jgi:hypothetical protein
MEDHVNFSEVSVLLQSEPGSVKTSYMRQQPPSKGEKSRFYGSCLQIGRETKDATNRWILCYEQEDNSVRLEDFSKDFTFSENILIFHLDNPLLFKPEIKEYDNEILISFMTTSYATYFFAFPNPRSQEDYKITSIFAGVNTSTLQNSYFFTNFSKNKPTAFDLVKPHTVAVGLDDGTLCLVTLNKEDKNRCNYQELKDTFFWQFGSYSKIVSIRTLVAEHDDLVFCLEESGKVLVWSSGSGKCIFSKKIGCFHSRIRS